MKMIIESRLCQSAVFRNIRYGNLVDRLVPYQFTKGITQHIFCGFFPHIEPSSVGRLFWNRHYSRLLESAAIDSPRSSRASYASLKCSLSVWLERKGNRKWERSFALSWAARMWDFSAS